MKEEFFGGLTVEVPPAGDVAGGPVGRNLSGLWEAGDTDAVAHDGALVQLQQSQVVPEEGDAPEFRSESSRKSICCHQSALACPTDSTAPAA